MGAPAAGGFEHLGRALGLDDDAAQRLEDGADRAPRTVVGVGHQHARVVQRAEAVKRRSDAVVQ